MAALPVAQLLPKRSKAEPAEGMTRVAISVDRIVRIIRFLAGRETEPSGSSMRWQGAE